MATPSPLIFSTQTTLEPIPFEVLMSNEFLQVREQLEEQYSDEEAALLFYTYIGNKYGLNAKAFMQQLDIVAESFVEKSRSESEEQELDNKVHAFLSSTYGREKADEFFRWSKSDTNDNNASKGQGVRTRCLSSDFSR